MQGADSVIWTQGYPDGLNALNGTSFGSYGGAFGGFGFGGIDVSGFLPDVGQGVDVSGIRLGRYEYNGLLPTTREFSPSIEAILESMPGAELFQSSDGLWKIVLPDSMTDEAIQSVGVIDDDHLMQPVAIEYPDSAVKVNRVNVKFNNVNKQMASDDITYPKRDSTAETNLLAADNNCLLYTSDAADE